MSHPAEEAAGDVETGPCDEASSSPDGPTRWIEVDAHGGLASESRRDAAAPVRGPDVAPAGEETGIVADVWQPASPA
jgi:hypothetical protein